MTTLETVKTELELAELLNMYCNEPLIKSIYNLVIRSLHFGIEEIDNSNLGVITKQIARDLHFKDGRKCVYSEVTCKNYLK